MSDIDQRWICYQCGDLDLLDDNGLCRDCHKPEQVAEFAQVAGRVVHGEPPELERVWGIR